MAYTIPKMKRTTVRLTDSQSRELEAMSKGSGLTVAELISRAVDAYIISYTPATHLAEAITKRKRIRHSDA
jgi:hypothetical protein